LQKSAKENEHLAKLIEEENDQLQAQLEEYEADRAQIKRRHEEYKTKILALEEEADQREADAIEMQQKIEEAKLLVVQGDEEITKLKDEVAQLKKNLAAAK